jgi:hypothetical protein
VEFPRCFRTLVVKIEKTNSNSTRDFSKRINFTRVDLFVWSTLVVKIKKRRNHSEHILGEHNFTTVVSPLSLGCRQFEFRMPNFDQNFGILAQTQTQYVKKVCNMYSCMDRLY